MIDFIKKYGWKVFLRELFYAIMVFGIIYLNIIGLYMVFEAFCKK